MSISAETLSKYRKYANAFVETGTYLGQTCETAARLGFNPIHTIEVSLELWQQAENKFANTDIRCWAGDSIRVLPIILKYLNEPAVFWLDGHWSQGITSKGVKDVPLLEELETIKNHYIKNHTIIIDDVRLFGNEEDVVDWHDVTLERVESMLRDINPDYKIVREDGAFPNDILVAYVEQ